MMNNRLQALANQAELYVDLCGRPYPRAMSAEEADAAYKKFAELIVRGCMDIVHKRGLMDVQALGVAYGINNQIMKHFGVEE